MLHFIHTTVKLKSITVKRAKSATEKEKKWNESVSKSAETPHDCYIWDESGSKKRLETEVTLKNDWMSCCIRFSIKSSVFYQRGRCKDTVYKQSVWQTEVSCVENPKTTDAEHLWS